MTTGSILGNMETALKKSDSDSWASGLKELVSLEPERWSHLLLLSNALPDPCERSFEAGFGPTLRALRSACEDLHPDHTLVAMRLFLEMVTVYQVVREVRKHLEELGLWSNANSTSILRLAAFVEDQSHILHMKIDKDVAKTGKFDPMSLLADTSVSRDEVNTGSLQGAIENLSECFQLILKYVCFERGGIGELSGELGSPYSDSDIEKVLWLATAWRSIRELWERVRYLSWRSISKDGGLLFLPPNIDDHLRYEVGNMRRESLKAQVFSVGMRHRDRFSERPEALARLAKGVRFDRDSLIWDAALDVGALRDFCGQTMRSVHYNIALDMLHYREIASRLKIGTAEREVAWTDFFACWNVLASVATIYRYAARKSIKNTETAFAMHEVFLVHETRLVDLIAATIKLPTDTVRRCVGHLCQEPRSRFLEVWDAPMLRMGDDLLLVIPAIAASGDPIRSLENHTSQWSERLFGLRGKMLEDEAKAFLEGIPGVTVEGPVNFPSEDEHRNIEFDLIARWQDKVILIEAKCTKSVFSPSDLHRAAKRIEEAIEQLEVRRRVVLSETGALSRVIPNVIREGETIDPTNVIGIALTNVTHFTGNRGESPYVMDEFAFRRFFDDAPIEYIEGGEVVGELVRLRKGAAPSVSEFVGYLKGPPQVAELEKLHKPGFYYCARFDEKSPKIGAFKYDFVGIDPLIAKAKKA